MRRQSGAVMLLVLIVLIGVAMVGAATARSGTVAAQSARHMASYLGAFAAAQVALADAEMEIRSGSRAHLFRTFDRWPSDGCAAGLCAEGVWQAMDLEAGQGTVEYGSFTGRSLPSHAGRLPRYLIELVRHGAAGEDASTVSAAELRITAVGYGPGARTMAVVQSTYRMEPP